MIRFPLTTLGTLGLVCASSAVQADVTAQQVWDNLADQMAIYGEGFTTGPVSQSGDTLTVPDVRIEFSDASVSAVAKIGDLALTENGDGTVTITTPESYPLSINLTTEEGEPIAVHFIISQENMAVRVSGEPEEATFEFDTDRYAITLDAIEGEDASDVGIETATLSFLDWSGHYTISGDDMTRISSELNLGAVDLDISVTEFGRDDLITGTFDITDITAFSNAVSPESLNLEAEYPPFKDGLSLEAGYSIGSLEYAFDIVTEEGTLSSMASAEDAELSFAVSYEELKYSGSLRSLDMNMVMPEELPLPISFGIAQQHFELQIPLSQSTDDTLQDARFSLEMSDLIISDAIWDLIDPQQILSRAPVTIALGMDAQIKLFFDLLDPDQQEALALTDVPGELHGMQLTDLTLRGGGAEITGNGAFTFDNSDFVTFDGFPRPEGELNFDINGINGLLDSLIAIGVVPEEDAFVPRMMLGMFTTPVGDDALTSQIEVNTEGQVLANGQRLR